MGYVMTEAFELVDPDAVVFDGFDEAVIGYTHLMNRGTVLVYDYQKIAYTLMEQGMSEDEAFEYVDYNIVGLWAGEKTPVILMPA